MPAADIDRGAKDFLDLPPMLSKRGEPGLCLSPPLQELARGIRSIAGGFDHLIHRIALFNESGDSLRNGPVSDEAPYLAQRIDRSGSPICGFRPNILAQSARYEPV